ncbi:MULTISPECIES: phage head-tail connector protein [Bacillus subtilis group]|uniref:phage head-tail connector protein n=1 Tax=Bacillus subtilis group TaxID=653685 RepID=UPI00227F4079|nr:MULTISPECIES: phage head-tail connector protein [Bacillus subtilis group]MCY9096361.1 phage head-tail connector protein [Bacillus inaquosorum]MEC3664062.1 phage head-tail connector protein [Bacillus subtilis]
MQSLENVKTLIPIKKDDVSKDDILILFIKRAEETVLGYCNLDELKPGMQSIVEDIAIIYYRNRRVQNLKGQTKGSLSETYRDDLPPTIYKRLNRFRRLKMA